VSYHGAQPKFGSGEGAVARAGELGRAVAEQLK